MVSKKHYIHYYFREHVPLESKKNYASNVPVSHGGTSGIFSSQKNILDFSSNINPLGFPKEVKKSIKENIDCIIKYPDPESRELTKLLSKHLRLENNKIVIGNGASELIYAFCNAFFKKNIQVVIPIPTFGEYEVASYLNEAKITFFRTMDLEEDLDSFIKQIPQNSVLFLCNPNNPTGKAIGPKSILKILKDSKKKDTFLFLDESFVDFIPYGDYSSIQFLKKFDNLFILRSLTKLYGLAGLRIGYGLSDKQIISIVKNSKTPWSVSNLAQISSIKAIESKTHLQKTHLLIKKEYHYLKNAISKLKNFEVYESSCNFILIKSKINSKLLQTKLLKKNILIRDCSNFKGLDDHHFRIAVRTRRENQKLVQALRCLD